jgi:hypothetical protein
MKKWRRLQWIGLGTWIVLLSVWVVTVIPIRQPKTIDYFRGGHVKVVIPRWSRMIKVGMQSGAIFVTWEKTRGPVFCCRMEWNSGTHRIWWFKSDLSMQSRSVAYVIIPLWVVLVVLGATIGLCWRRPCAHSCNVCDYNLTGNTSGVCPECGTPISTSRI